MKESRNWFKYIRSLLFVLAFIGGTLAAFVIGLRYYVRWGMSAVERAEMDRFFTEPIKLPADWQEIRPFPPQLIEAREVLFDAWAAANATRDSEVEKIAEDRVGSTVRKLEKGEWPDDSEWESLENFVEWFRPCKMAARSLSATPGYELGVLVHSQQSMGLCALGVAHCLWAEGYLHAKEGRCREAFEEGLVSLRLARRHPASDNVTRSFGLAFEKGGARLIGHAAQQCDDLATLRRVLEEMNRLAPQLRVSTVEETKLAHIIGTLRCFAREGSELDLKSTAPRSYFFKQMIDLYRAHGYDMILPRNEQWAAQYTGWFGGSLEFLYRHSLRYCGGPQQMREELRTRTAFDLARLEIARRTEELEPGGKILSPAELLTKYFPDGLEDPFSPGQPYRWYEEGRYSYSVGPKRPRPGGKVPVTPEGQPGPDAVFIPRRIQATTPAKEK